MEGVCKYDKWRKGQQTDEHRHGLVCMRNNCTCPISIAAIERGIFMAGFSQETVPQILIIDVEVSHPTIVSSSGSGHRHVNIP